jgi:eukaryotic-like serine/threonine-protein kinase
MSGDRSEPLRPRDPRRLGDYELIGRLGEGGMGTVYLATTPAGAQVAVKVIRADLAPDDEFRRRFRSEVARARQVPPFCTAEVLDADPDHEQPYLVVEFVDGPTLADVVEERGPLTAANLHSVAIGVATALTAIHGAGVIHRDLKPRNVLLAPGSPKVIDFGIARATEATGGNTSPDQMVGTVAYMAPERFGLEADSPLTPAADVFAWGGVVAYAGTGRTPFAADSPPATAARILTQPPDLTGLTGTLRDLVARALHKDPAHRPSARELLDLLLDGPQRPAATAEALADQPDLRAAAAEAQAVTGFVAVEPGLIGYDEESIITVPITAMPASSEPSGPPPPEPRTRWFLPVAVAFLVLAVVAGAMMVVLGPPADEGERAASVTESAPTPSPTPVTAPPLISDSLRRERFWKARSYDKSRCSFDDALIAHRDNADPLRCQGPLDQMPADFRAEVTVRLITKSSCAGIWFRFDESRGYLVRVCQNNIYFGTHKRQGGTKTLRTFWLDTPITLGATSRIALTAAGTSLTLLRDGAPVGTVALTDRSITAGRLLLGEFADPDAKPSGTYEVAFTDISIWAATP